MPQTYVALDLETTGLDPVRDAIIEVGAVRFCEGRILDRFCSYVNPGRPIPPFITDLTGITDADVAAAPSLSSVLSRLGGFVGERPVVGHNVGFDLAFLRRHGMLQSIPSLDTFELAGILVPHAERYNLGGLARLLDVEVEQAHRALDDARVTQGVFCALQQRATQLPVKTLQELVRHGERVRWAPAHFFREALEVKSRAGAFGSIGAQLAARRGGDAALPLFAVTERPRDLQPAEQRRPVDEAGLAALLGPDGAFAAHFPAFEHRPQQIAMLRAVAAAINEGRHLLIEAPTGVGKSVAYLLPAVYWAVQNGERVVVSTNTINLQEQLFHKDLPELVRLLPPDFRAVVLKGRSHYLCLASLRVLRRTGPATHDEMLVLAKLLIWLPSTLDGDGDSLFLPTPGERSAWARLSADAESCDPERCDHFYDESCFFYRARRAAESAHVVIVNHALLLADVGTENRVLPEYRYLIVDEAHHLEAATTSALSFAVDRNTARRQLEALGATDARGRPTGLLAEAMALCQGNGVPREIRAQMAEFVTRLAGAGDQSIRLMDECFELLDLYVREHCAKDQSDYGLRARVTSGARVQPSWERVEVACDDLMQPLGAVVDGAERLPAVLDELPVDDDAAVEALRMRVQGVARQLAELKDEVYAFVCRPSAERIYWLEQGPGQAPLSQHAAPLHVGPLIEHNLFHTKESVILTSATLRTAGTFDYIRERLNAADADVCVVGSPFDYQLSTLVYLVEDVPEPNKPGYQRAIEQGMHVLFRATRGRALALFTSYSQLRSTARAITAPLAQAGVTVYVQGGGSSRRQLLENFRNTQQAVLMGTRSFWEGVDVPGEALSCLAIAKLPFDVPTDPVYAARAETYDQPFLEYAVPEAILRFRQGFGRLIRTRSDRGVVVVFDSRLLNKKYGALFIESLPSPTLERGPLTRMPGVVSEWLARPV